MGARIKNDLVYIKVQLGNEAKSVVFLGMTGAGKSTLANSLYHGVDAMEYEEE